MRAAPASAEAVLLFRTSLGDASTDVEEAAWRRLVAEGYCEFAVARGFHPESFWHMTFDEERKGRISPERALAAWRWFVRTVNIRMYGSHYRRKCKHSMFSYIAAVDYSTLGAVHLHAVVDGWLDMRIAFAVWNAAYGAPSATLINTAEDYRVAIAHVVKYAAKGSDAVAFWFRDRAPGRVSPYAVSAQGASR